MTEGIHTVIPSSHVFSDGRRSLSSIVGNGLIKNIDPMPFPVLFDIFLLKTVICFSVLFLNRLIVVIKSFFF